jgi:UDP-glucuronate 4-epimerase
MGKEAKKNFMDIQAGDVESTYADTSGLIEDFDYAPHTPLHKGIGEFVTWYEAYCKKI